MSDHISINHPAAPATSRMPHCTIVSDENNIRGQSVKAIRYLAGTAEIDPTRREVRRGGKVVDVEPRVFDLIVFLVENAERVVSKEDLIEALWDGRAIADTTLSTCVKAARRALGDNGRDQRIIRTLHGRGFRFVEPLGNDTEQPQQLAAVSSDDAPFNSLIAYARGCEI